MRVKSRGLDLGSTFVLALPVSHVQSEDPTRVRRSEASADPLETIELPRLDGIAVLIADDEPDGRALVARILEGRGARPTCVKTAAEALERLQHERFDVLLSDIGMPEMDGYELLKRARMLDGSRPRPLPAIAVTAYARSEDRQRSLLAGFQMHLSKPIEARELIAAIASLLQISQ